MPPITNSLHSGSVPVISAPHPLATQDFIATASKTEDIKNFRSTVRAMCSTCLKVDNGEDSAKKLRRCGTCKSVWYCSKQCQKEDWPEHKLYCSEVDGSGIARLLENLYSNEVLHHHLQACFILHFDLLNDPHSDRMFMARFDVAIEPTDMSNFLAIFRGEKSKLGMNEKMEGMLQINSVSLIRPTDPLFRSSTIQNMWRRERTKADADPVSAGRSIGMMEFGNGDGNHTITFAVHIVPAALHLVQKSEPWIVKDPITGQETLLPFNIDSCLEYMNMHIRADKKNQLLLRAHMRPSDVQIIRDAGAGVDGRAANFMIDKMCRESVFTTLLAGPKGARYVPIVDSGVKLK
ncbi:hypothetical protein R3P38DRAFT_3041967 [Favolaschia claudopus]|uniref:MYND-type domain-containing protein n=1 Tax=Favolaschia claudopus TaxID=2862362 RepID=A0AAW0A7N6_9AGAR